MRGLATGLALLVAAACAAPPPAVLPTAAPTATREPGTLAVAALLDLSGARAPKGDAQRDALQQWIERQRAGGPRVRLTVVDVGGSDARLVLELRRIAIAGEADAIVVGVPAALDDALAAALALVRRPALFTLPLDEPAGGGEGRRWAFGLAATPDAIAALLVAALPSRATAALIVTDGTLASGRERIALETRLRQAGRAAPFALSAAAEGRDGFAQRLRPFAATALGAYFTGAAASYVGPQRLVPAPDAGTAFFPFLSYLTDPADASRLGDAAAIVRWPGPRAAAGTAQGGHAATAADALAILVTAAADGIDAERLRQRIESGTFAGIATSYAFGPSRHAGADPTDLTLLAWEGGRVTIARPLQSK